MTTTQVMKIQAYLDQFPWLTRYISRDGIKDISVSRISSELLGKTPEKELVATNLLGSWTYAWEQIYLLDGVGDEVGEVCLIPVVPGPNFRRWQFWKWFRRSNRRVEENVSDALARLGRDSGRVQFALQFSHGGWRGDVRLNDVTIYKSPKGFNLVNWAEQLRDRARNTLKQQIAEVDTKV